MHGRPAHGYAIITALRERSAGRFELAEGTIYPALHKLESSG
ncbi:MAG: PadR family transcriptional regulator, partial [Actinomycetota bacterium]|nr:PadR family transcriptional regulator [Actinomycetota bacterium]